MATQYNAIYFNQSRVPGQVRMSESGLGWKATDKPQGGSAAKVSEPFLLPAKELLSAHWSRGARNFMVKIQTKSSGIVQLDGFDSEDFNALKNALNHNFSLNLEPREHSVRGWNWGSADFERNELVFNVASRPTFEIPYSAVANSNTVGKSEVAIELNLEAANERTSGGDELVEVRFYVPGTVAPDAVKEENGVKKESNGVKKEEEGEEEEEEEEFEYNAADIFYNQLQKNADIGMVTGAELIAFADILFVTPRGRYDMDMFEESFRLRGKSYDYKVNYSTIQRIFVLPKLDDVHNLVMLQLDPPLRQGQTRYPFLVMQFLREEELEAELNVSQEDFDKKYANRLEKTYEESAFQVVANLFKGLSNRKITFVGSFVSSHNQPAVNCSLKAAEGSLYVLEKAFVFVSKSPVYIPFTEIASVRFSRVGGSVSASRTFDMSVTLRAGSGEHQFSNIDREEQTLIENYVKSKNIKTVNDLAENQKIFETALAESGSDVEMAGGSQDEESEDEDFNAEDESDPAEEFDSEAEDDDDDDEDDDDDDDSDHKSRPSKKARH